MSHYLSHIKKGFLLGYPVMLSMLGQIMSGVADSIMIGQTGAEPLAACSLANVFFTMPLIFGVGVSFAITPLVAQAHGVNDNSKIIEVLKHGRLIDFVTGVVLIGLVYALLPLLFHIGQPHGVAELAWQYMLVLTPALLPIMVFQTFRQFTEGMHLTRMTMVIVIGSNLINIWLNYLLIYGNMGFPAMGIVGAGWATLISKCLMAGAMFLYVYAGKQFTRLKTAFGWGNYSAVLIRKMLNIGVPVGWQFLFEGGAFGMSSIMMGWLGAEALAAHQIALNLATVSYMMTSGLGSAATIMTSHYLGKKDQKNMRKSTYAIMFLALLFMGFSAMAFILGRELLPALYVSEASVIGIASSLLVVAAFFQLSDGLQVVCTSSLRGLQDVKIPTLFIFAAYWIIALPLGYLMTFVFDMGPLGIWSGLLVGLTLTATAMWLRFRKLSTEYLRFS